MIPIAVVGIDCRFPCAPDKDAFWQVLLDGVVTDTEVPAQRWNVDTYYDPQGSPGTMNTRRGHFIDSVDAFDHNFFGIAAVEAAALDPQQRLLLEASWRAIEDAGIDPRSLAGTQTGVFVGIMSSEWSSLQLKDFAGLTPFRTVGSGYFMAANRISYHLGLTGPSVAIDSACSSSLSAVHHACVALRAGEADTVIAGGTNLILSPGLSIFYTQAGLSAPDGRCKPFSQYADGIGRGEGVGAVVLRRLDDALAARQPVYAVVRSSVANHDGRSSGITAPNRRSQVELMRRALDLAEIDAAAIGFVEAHGTGTVLGDAIEVNALGDLHRTRRDEPCWLGSVKGNIGHTEGSAGIASFIKACLALDHRVLPPTAFGSDASSDLQLDELGLRLADAPQELSPAAAVGAISSFGLGGSNAHVILESAPETARPVPGRHGVLTISAPSSESLRRNIAPIAPALERLDPDHVASWCQSTNVVKRSHRHRVVVHGDRHALLSSLKQFAAGARPDLESSAPLRGVPATVGLLFPGQGTLYAGMTRALYDSNLVYRANLDTAAAAVNTHLDVDVVAAIFGDDPDLSFARIAQPALFVVSYALGKTLLHSSVKPAFGIGHSLGEVAAACLAGVLSIDAAARLVVVRGQLMDTLPYDGAMISADLSPQEASAVLDYESACAIAAVNGPRSVTISGPAEAVRRAQEWVREQGLKSVKLPVSQAFHSPQMNSIVDDFRRALEGIEARDGDFPLFSTVLGRQVEGHEMDAEYWARQITSPVRFYDAAQAALNSASPAYLAEAGPKSVLLALLRRSELATDAGLLPLCSGPYSHGTELFSVAATMMRDGYSCRLAVLYGRLAGANHRLPPYLFDDSHRFWLDESVTGAESKPLREKVDGPDPSVQPPPAPVPAPVPQNVETGILELIADLVDRQGFVLGRSERLVEDLGFESLHILHLLERLRVQYPQLRDVTATEVMPNISTVGDLVDFLVQQLESAAIAAQPQQG